VTVTHAGPMLPAANVEDAVELVRARGLRVSAARRLVIEALFATRNPVSAEEIADGLGGRSVPSDVGSVYRNLETLERLGLVRHFHLGHGPGRYALAGHEAREYLYCESCGATRAVEPAELDAVRELVRNELDFHARFTHFPIAGLCSECAEEDQPHGRPATADAARSRAERSRR